MTPLHPPRHPGLMQGPAGGGGHPGEGHGECAQGGGDDEEPPPQEPVRRAGDDRGAGPEGVHQAWPGQDQPRRAEVRPL